MPIMLRLRDGKLRPFRNAEYIPAYYFIPKEFLDRCPEKLRQIPRNPRELFHSWKAIHIVESDLFLLLMIDAYAYMVWPFMGDKTKMESYSGNEPSWALAHSVGFWVQELTDEGTIPTVEALFEGGGVDENFGYVPIEGVSVLLSQAVPAAMDKHNMAAVIETAREYRCFEDFDYRNSRKKIDFYRQWYHTRTEHPMISLEGWKEDYRRSHDGQEWDAPDESVDVEAEACAEALAAQFMATLSEKDKQILELRRQGWGQEEIAKELGFKNHSGIQKRIRKIGLAYEKFAGKDLGF